jgi:hypothetical protein
MEHEITAEAMEQLAAELRAFAVTIGDRDRWLAQTLRNRAAWWSGRATDHGD